MRNLTAAAAACGLLVMAGGAAAQAEPEVVVYTRDAFTEHQTLRGTMRFDRPAGWREHPKSGTFSRRFTATEAQDCDADVQVSIRGKATRASVQDQVALAVGVGSLAHGPRRGGAFGISALDTETNYGIAVVRVSRRRFGQLRVFATFTGAGCSAGRIRGGHVTAALTRVLRDARSRLRLGRL